MCTIMFYRETLPAEKRSREDSQEAVDRLMEYDRQFSAGPSSDEDSRKAPLFEDQPYGISSAPWGRGGPVYVWLDNMNYCSEKKGFYYVRYHNSILECHRRGCYSTAYAHPVLVVQKNKLRPDQVEYMERKCRETLEDSRREHEARKAQRRSQDTEDEE